MSNLLPKTAPPHPIPGKSSMLLPADAAAPVAGAISTMFFFYALANAFLDAARVRYAEVQAV
jgi:hypothetical protein